MHFFCLVPFSKQKVITSREFRLPSLWVRTLKRDKKFCHCYLGHFSSLVFNVKTYILQHCAHLHCSLVGLVCATLLHAGKYVLIQGVFVD